MSNEEHPYTNHLIHESSPYLLQHAHNPVNWYPWGEEALEKARREKKPIIISIGYAACHWCHVMEHESFEDTTVARFMNDNFVCIKVDREERPDIDQIYMNAVQLITGSGGWPLNCIALPDGRPVYGGTYFPKERWLNMLGQVLTFIQQQPEKAEQQANALTEGVQSEEDIVANTAEANFSMNDLNQVFANWKGFIDYTWGGQPRAPKFPMPTGYQFLLQYYYLTGNEDALKAVTVTLDKMAEGGIYDQVGGGFARYSTDAVWKVPHFEKMLYDNAQLVSLYAAAYQLTKNPKYKTVVEETLEFVSRELTSKEGGFYSSLDADSEGEEGKFYVWRKEEIEKILGADAPLFMDYYSVKDKGNWEGGNNILYITESDQKVAAKNNISVEQLQQKIVADKRLLLKARSSRISPALDDKILTAWNAIMLKGYVDAYRVFNDKKYLTAALRNADFIHTKMQQDDYRLNRNFKNGKGSINGFLDDYAFTISAYISLYQVTFDEKWLKEAKSLTDYTLEHFFDTKSGLFFYTSNLDPALIARKMEVSDNVIPAANSEMAKNLFVLGQYFYKDDFIAKAKLMLNNMQQNAIKSGPYYANWNLLMSWFVSEPYEVAIVGQDYDKIRIQFDQYFLPNVLLSGGKEEGKLALLENKLVPGKTMIYVCRNKTCKLPVTTVLEAVKQIGK